MGWFELNLQFQTAQCQMFITVNSTLIYFQEIFFDQFLYAHITP